MATLEDVSGALRAVWEVRRAEEQQAYCLGAWHNIVFGIMAAVIFAAYTVAEWLAAPRLVFAWLWLPPVLGAYTALAFLTKAVLRLPRATLPWGEIAVGTVTFVGLMGLLALALLNGVLRDIHAGMSIVIGVFYIILGVVFIRERAPALFGLGLAAGAVALVLLGLPFPASTLYGIIVAAGGMVAMGAWMLRHPEHGAPPASAGGEGGPPELYQVRETLRGLRGHETAVRARERSAQVFLAAAVLALAAVASVMSGQPTAPWALLGLAGLAALVGFVVRGRAHGA